MHARCFNDILTLWTVAHKAPQSLGFSRQEVWNGLPFPPPGDLPDPGIKPSSPVSQALQAILYCWATGEDLIHLKNALFGLMCALTFFKKKLGDKMKWWETFLGFAQKSRFLDGLKKWEDPSSSHLYSYTGTGNQSWKAVSLRPPVYCNPHHAKAQAVLIWVNFLDPVGIWICNSW